jgi:hypothetical protein
LLTVAGQCRISTGFILLSGYSDDHAADDFACQDLAN